MKKLLLLFTFLSLTSGIFAQVSKTINVETAGTLSPSLTSNELATITNLTITGTIDARDFKTMRDNMPLLAVLDLSGVTIVAYNGTLGTSNYQPDYPANTIPENAFLNKTWQGKISLTSIVFPVSLTAIGDYSFYSCSGLTSLVIPSSVTSIGYSAFYSCSGLTTVTIPSSVTSIGEDAFRDCSGLITVTIPSSVISIGKSVFYGCSGLTTVTIPSSVTSIGDWAFVDCRGLTTVVIPSSVTLIGNYAFLRCSGCTTVAIPSSVTSIGEGVFAGCSGLTTVAIPSSVTSIGDYAFSGCSGLTTIEIPTSVNSIGNDVFSYCSGLTSVTIPSSVTSVANYAFYGCSGLITVDSNNPNYSSLDGVLYDKSQTLLIHCPTSKIESFIIPSSVTSIGNAAFNNCRELTTVTIPSSVISIEESAFINCDGLTSIITSRITPINLSVSYGVFDSFKTTCTLYVPLGSKSAYQVADQWKDFANIVEKDLTGIDPIISDQKLNIYPNPTTGKVKLVFDQIPQGGETLTVNDFTGKTILTQSIQNKEEWIDLKGNSPGVYLIRTNMKDFKVQKIILK